MNLDIYKDALVNGWMDYGWATRDFSNTSVVRSGKSIKVQAQAYEGLHIHHAPFDTSLFKEISLWINGGTSGCQLKIGAFLSGKSPKAYNIPSVPANTWQQVIIPLTTLEVANKPDCDGIYIADISGSSATYYIDDMSFIGVSAPSNIDITVNSSQSLRTVDNRLFGLNNGTWESSFLSPDNTPLLDELDIKILRFPGGSLSDEYHWETSSTTKNGTTTTQPLTFDQFATGAIAAGCDAFITVNYGSGTATEAANWVEHSKLEGYNFKYWEIGNECYGTWEYDINTKPHDPSTYATRAKDYINAMKAKDPNIKIGVVVVTGEDSYSNNGTVSATNPRTNTTHYGWTPVVLATLKAAGVIPDFVVYHKYIAFPWYENDFTLLQSANSIKPDVQNLRQMINDYLGSAGSNVEIVVTEYNSVWQTPTGKQTASLVNALFCLDSIGAALQTDVKALVWWLLRSTAETNGNNSSALYGWRNYGTGYGIISQQNTGYEKYPTFYAFKLLSKFARAGDAVVPVSVTYPMVSAYAVKKANGNLALLLINKSANTAYTPNVNITGFSPKASASVFSYGIPQDEAARLNSGNKDLEQSSISNAGSSFSVQLPAYSAKVITLEPEANLNGTISLFSNGTYQYANS